MIFSREAQELILRAHAAGAHVTVYGPVPEHRTLEHAAADAPRRVVATARVLDAPEALEAAFRASGWSGEAFYLGAGRYASCWILREYAPA